MAFLDAHFSLTNAAWHGLMGVLSLISAIGLLRFRKWAFCTGIVTIVLATAKLVAFMVTADFDPWQFMPLVVLILMLDYLCRKPAREILFPPE